VHKKVWTHSNEILTIATHQGEIDIPQSIDTHSVSYVANDRLPNWLSSMYRLSGLVGCLNSVPFLSFKVGQVMFTAVNLTPVYAKSREYLHTVVELQFCMKRDGFKIGMMDQGGKVSWFCPHRLADFRYAYPRRFGRWSKRKESEYVRAKNQQAYPTLFTDGERAETEVTITYDETQAEGDGAPVQAT
jgi:hypothetical protein